MVGRIIFRGFILFYLFIYLKIHDMNAKKYFVSWIFRRTSKSAKKSYPTEDFSPHDIYH